MIYDFGRLRLLCGRASSLPPLAASVARLLKVTESTNVSTKEIASIIAADPMLSTRLLRAANTDWDFAGMAKINSVEGAVMRLGINTVRSMATSLGVHSLFMSQVEGCVFDPLCYARHSVVVGLMARALLARSQERKDFRTFLSADDVFAAALLHDLPVALLAWVAPGAYDVVHEHCKSRRVAIERGFAEIFGGSICELGTSAIKTWGMPEIFELVVRWSDQPLSAPKESRVVALIHFASWVADSNVAQSNGFSSAPWSCPADIDPQIQELVDIEQEEIDEMFSTVLNQIEEYLPSKVMNGAVYLRGRRVA